LALRGTLTHRKVRRLASLLDISACFALGVVESLWHVTAEQAPTGAIGRLTNEDIAMEMFYDGDPGAMVDALLAAGLLEADPVHRLIIHDWHIHSDDATDNKLSRGGERYANGQPTRMRRLSDPERQRLKAKYPEAHEKNGNANHAVRTESQEKPLPAPEPAPAPEPEPVLKKKSIKTERVSTADAADPALFQLTPPTKSRTPTEYATFWNKVRGTLPAVELPLSHARADKLRSRIREGLTPARFKAVLDKIHKSPFCMGENDRRWKANFDFLIRNQENVGNILNGNYDRAAPPKPVHVLLTDAEETQ
jgi:hypothetical protein